MRKGNIKWKEFIECMVNIPDLRQKYHDNSGTYASETFPWYYTHNRVLPVAKGLNLLIPCLFNLSN